MTVEVFYKGKRVAFHRRSYKKGSHTTLIKHMPKKHQAYAKWTPERLINWTSKQGEFTALLAKKIIESRPHPQQGFRSCMGLISLGNGYGTKRLESACQRALNIQAYSYVKVKKNSIVKAQENSIVLGKKKSFVFMIIF